MQDKDLLRIDGLKWWMTTDANDHRLPVPLCPDHDLRLTPILPRVYSAIRRANIDGSASNAVELECAEGPHTFSLPRTYGKEKSYVINRVDAKVFKGMKVLNLDDEMTPIAKDKIKSDDGKYFVTSQLMQSKRGLQLVVYAGEKGSSKKSQIFVEPEVKRLAFDQRDLHPSDVFVEMTATFDDGTKTSISQG